MKIFYAVQATGNGHISRAMEILPYLQQYGEVDIFLSGSNSTLEVSTPIKYRSKGLSLFYTNHGGLHYANIAKQIAPYKLYKEIKELPVEKYDLVLNDFDSITAMACAFKKIPSVNFGHQASFASSKVPRPHNQEWMGEWILKNYAKASKYIGLHFDNYDDFILTPVIKDEIFNATPTNQGYVTVYLPSYADAQLLQYFTPLKNHRFQIFSREVKQTKPLGHITLLPVNNKAFNQSLIHCHGIITGAGFETPAEALHLQKKLLAIPIKGQYEQKCNAAALEQLGVKVIKQLDENFTQHFNNWMDSNTQIKVHYHKNAATIVANAIEMCSQPVIEFPDFGYGDLQLGLG
jgi:uncharacterized protein (TIGR00661 family)